jgi:hypothetical protein
MGKSSLTTSLFKSLISDNLTHRAKEPGAHRYRGGRVNKQLVLNRLQNEAIDGRIFKSGDRAFQISGAITRGNLRS